MITHSLCEGFSTRIPEKGMSGFPNTGINKVVYGLKTKDLDEIAKEHRWKNTGRHTGEA